MKPDHPRARQTAVVGCELIRFLLDSEEVGPKLFILGLRFGAYTYTYTLVMNRLGLPLLYSSTHVLVNHVEATPIEILLAQPESDLFSQ